MLRVDQQAVSAAFSGRLKGKERFTVGEWELDAHGLPRLLGAQASMACRTERTLDYGTHSIFIGTVLDVCLADEVAPLLYQDGRYARSEYLIPVEGHP